MAACCPQSGTLSSFSALMLLVGWQEGRLAYTSTVMTMTKRAEPGVIPIKWTGNRLDRNWVCVLLMRNYCYYCYCCCYFIIMRRIISRILRLARLSVPYGLVTRKQRNAEKPKLTLTFHRRGVSRVSIFSWKGQRSRLQDVKPHLKLALCLLTGGRSSAGASGTDCKLGQHHCKA